MSNLCRERITNTVIEITSGTFFGSRPSTVFISDMQIFLGNEPVYAFFQYQASIFSCDDYIDVTIS